MRIGETSRSIGWTSHVRGLATGVWVPGFLTPAACVAAIVAALASITAMVCHAQSTVPAAQDPLTPAYLIGDALSVSGKTFPEIEDAITRFRNEDGSGALEILMLAVKENPKLPPATLLLARMQSLTGNGPAVRGLLERTVLEHPDDPESYLILADQAFQANRTTESDALFHFARPLVEKFTANLKRKRNFQVRILAGSSAIAERRGQWDKSHQLLTEWIESDPENVGAHRRLGLTLFKQEKHKEALREFSKARELSSELGHPYIVMAQLYHNAGDKEMAQKFFDRAYKEEPQDVTTAHSYADWMIYQGKLEEAQAIAKSLLDQDANAAPALLLDGMIAHMQGDRSRCEQSLQKLLVLEPAHAQAADMLALMLIESDQVEDQERALSYAEMNAGRFPDNAQANITKAWVLYKLGRKSEAQQSLTQGTKGGGPMLADSRYLIARIMVAEGHRQKALGVLQAKAVSPGFNIFRKESQQLQEELKGEPGGLTLEKQ
ncbi:MAG: tetratricopeptide repeat protein [Pirellulales bacterium]|nr:tetratricopeptide repeat protein [Pirellulales bacterium]